MGLTNQNSENKKKKKKNLNPESEFRFALDTCSKNKDLIGALSLFERAVSQNLTLNSYHFNNLLYLFSNSLSETLDPSSKNSILENGFKIFDRMLGSNINPTEATITAVARLAAAKDDGDFAFELVKTMGKYNISPRLRSYGPALFVFCRKNDAEKAYEVEEHMVFMGFNLEEPEIAALLKVSAECGREEKVYLYLQKLRNSVRCVMESTAEIIEGWFLSKLGSDVGNLNWDAGRIKDAVLKNGGGWHGQGWLGEGKWEVCRSNVSLEGRCCCCGEYLDCIDIDRLETQKFAESVASLAMQRELKSNFKDFQKWLDDHTEYEFAVDGANVGFYQQNFAEGGFNLSQLNSVVQELYKRTQKWPLVILHTKRVRALMEVPSNQQFLEEWKARGALYTTPNGSNDDWYWLYAAVKLKCLLVTNDEMRDHIFELLGRNFFLKWKERHQVRFTFVKCALRLQMPPSFSTVIQESEKGSWHVPLDVECGTWLCINRQKSCENPKEISVGLDSHEIDRKAFSDQTSASSFTVTSECGFRSFSVPSQLPVNGTLAVNGKRKDRSPSPSNFPPH
ncbi:proteinaceous RNase P 2-like [Tasmannia lanceolata]|uniref:proteinaceous RNase P 2-like n=1 Tax=Tasmannia lanceolata TaxID=3420 RepID=UPI0040637F90